MGWGEGLGGDGAACTSCRMQAILVTLKHKWAPAPAPALLQQDVAWSLAGIYHGHDLIESCLPTMLALIPQQAGYVCMLLAGVSR